jgi:hypothetical protein
MHSTCLFPLLRYSLTQRINEWVLTKSRYAILSQFVSPYSLFWKRKHEIILSSVCVSVFVPLSVYISSHNVPGLWISWDKPFCASPLLRGLCVLCRIKCKQAISSSHNFLQWRGGTKRWEEYIKINRSNGQSPLSLVQKVQVSDLGSDMRYLNCFVFLGPYRRMLYPK